MVSILFLHRSKRYYEQSSQGTVAKISSSLGKIRGALQNKQPIEGLCTPESQMYENNFTQCTEGILPSFYTIKDLSAWRVDIPTVDTKMVILLINILF